LEIKTGKMKIKSFAMVLAITAEGTNYCSAQSTQPAVIEEFKPSALNQPHFRKHRSRICHLAPQPSRTGAAFI
jgi:hypothetical protein